MLRVESGLQLPESLSQTRRYTFGGRLETLKKVLIGTLPCLLGIAVVTSYVYGVFVAYRAADNHFLKTFVYICALGVKMAGNKLQLWLIGRLRFMRPDTVDEIVFVYEYVTCLLCRVMLLSMPSDQTAVFLSVLNATFELMLRNGFFVKLLADGGRLSASAEKQRWLRKVVPLTHASTHVLRTHARTHAPIDGRLNIRRAKVYSLSPIATAMVYFGPRRCGAFRTCGWSTRATTWSSSTVSVRACGRVRACVRVRACFEIEQLGRRAMRACSYSDRRSHTRLRAANLESLPTG